MNLIAYSLSFKALRGNVKKRIPEIRDSIGKTHIPGRLKGSYMITEKAYRPYFYKTKNTQVSIEDLPTELEGIALLKCSAVVYTKNSFFIRWEVSQFKLKKQKVLEFATSVLNLDNSVCDASNRFLRFLHDSPDSDNLELLCFNSS